jgi:hypothetical protein
MLRGRKLRCLSLRRCADNLGAKRNVDCSHIVVDDDTLKQLLRINDELMQLCKWLNEKRDMETSSRLIPLVDDLSHILMEAGKNKLH